MTSRNILILSTVTIIGVIFNFLFELVVPFIIIISVNIIVVGLGTHSVPDIEVVVSQLNLLNLVYLLNHFDSTKPMQ